MKTLVELLPSKGISGKKAGKLEGLGTSVLARGQSEEQGQALQAPSPCDVLLRWEGGSAHSWILRKKLLS